MRKILLLAIISVFTMCGAYAQNNNTSPQFSIGISPGVAVGPVSSVYPAVGALRLGLTFPVAHSPVSLTFTTGYTFYTSSDAYGVGFDYGGFSVEAGGGSYSNGDVASFIPVMGGVKIYVAKRVFIAGEVGASFNVNTYPGDYTGKTTALIYSPSIGYTIPVGYYRKHTADFSLAYENRVEPGGGYTQIAFRAAYNFSL